MALNSVQADSMVDNRCYWLDISKGIGIILVIIGHCIFIYHPIIDLFNMPLFFLIAGVTFKSKTWDVFVISKINRIGIPYVFWMIVSSIFALIPHPYSGPFNGPLWFLQTIFVALIIANFIGGGENRFKLIAIMSAIALYCYVGVWGWLPDFLPFHMERALMACFYICSGILLSGFLKMARTRLVSAIYALLSWLFFGLMFWRLYDLGIDGAFLNLTIYAHHCILVLACSFAGILATVFVSQLIGRQRGLEWLGRNSLVIMCVHFPFAQVLNVKISQMAWYNSITGKVLFGLIEYAVVTGISVVLAILCKRYIPRITGYKPLICVDKRYAQS